MDDDDFFKQLKYMNPEQIILDEIEFTKYDTYSFEASLMDQEHQEDVEIELFWNSL